MNSAFWIGPRGDITFNAASMGQYSGAERVDCPGLPHHTLSAHAHRRAPKNGLAVERPGTRVLYMSGFTDDSIVRHGLLEEDIAFIQKPFTPESLGTKIQELLDDIA